MYVRECTCGSQNRRILEYILGQLGVVSEIHMREDYFGLGGDTGLNLGRIMEGI